MRIVQHLTFLLILSVSFNSHSNQDTPFKVVQDFFAATSAFDVKGLRAACTEDFQLLEIDELWDMDFLVKLTKRSEGKFQRRNFFSVIKQEMKGDMVWISYWNKAEFVDHGEVNKKNEAFWLESVVLIRKNNEWKIQMLHSSRAKPEKIPQDVVFEEYVGKS